MINTDLVIKAYEVAMKAHKGQTRWGGEPYITHPVKVAESMSSSKGKVAALLHDVVEDTDWTLDDIEREFGVEIRSVIDALTKREKEEYFDYISRLAMDITAIRVKLADLKHNLSDLDLKKHRTMFNKYKLAEMFLKERLFRWCA